MRQRWTRRGWTLLAALLLVVVSPGRAGAHANYEKSDPPANAFLEKAPGQIKVWFTEPPEPRFSELQVVDANQRRVDKKDLGRVPDDPRALTIGLDDLAPGTYMVLWKTLSAVDGHVARGGFPFTVGLDQAAPLFLPTTGGQTGASPWSVASRWLNLLTAIVLAGSFFFLPGLLGKALAATTASGVDGTA